MSFRVNVGNEPILNGITKRPASWPTQAAAQEWVDWVRTGHGPLSEVPLNIIEHHREES